MAEMERILNPAGNVMAKLPLSSAVVPLPVPFTNIEAEGTGLPAWSITFPVTLVSCANMMGLQKRLTRKHNNLSLMNYGL
jgi:hypothetical protein